MSMQASASRSQMHGDIHCNTAQNYANIMPKLHDTTILCCIQWPHPVVRGHAVTVKHCAQNYASIMLTTPLCRTQWPHLVVHGHAVTLPKLCQHYAETTRHYCVALSDPTL